MNILFPNVGAHDYLISHFKQALSGQGKVIAADASPYAAGLVAADVSLSSPLMADPNYVQWFVDTCRSESVDLVVSLHEQIRPDVIESLKSAGLTTIVLGSDETEAALVADKYVLGQELQAASLPFTETVLLEEALTSNKVSNFPVWVKPRIGRGGKDSFLVNSDQELAHIAEGFDSTSMVVQEHIVGQEFGIDVINDFSRDYFGTLAREKLSMKNGETYAAKVVSAEQFQDLPQRISALTRHLGSIDCDLIMTSGGVPYVIDINPRVGGGLAFSIKGGAQLAELYLKWLNGESADESLLEVHQGKQFVRSNNLVELP